MEKSGEVILAVGDAAPPVTVAIRSRWGDLPYMDYIGMYRCEGYGFQAVYSGIGYINQRVWV